MKRLPNFLKTNTFVSLWALCALCGATVAATTVAAAADDERLLDILDRELASGEKYVEERHRRIELLNEMRNRSDVTADQSYHINTRLYGEHASFQFDSAQMVLMDNLELARWMMDSEREADASIELGMLYTKSGMYLEAREMLDPLDSLSMSDAQKVAWAATQWRFYREAREYSVHPEMANQAAARQQHYRQLLFAAYDESSSEWLELAVETAMEAGDMHRADSLNAVLLSRASDSSHRYAMWAYNQALIDYALGREDFRDWYARSAIADVRSATKDNASLASLARQLFTDGEDIERAFRYVRVSMDDAIFYNAKLRPWQIAQFMPIIEQTYFKRVERARRTQWVLSGVILLAAGYAFVMFRRARSFAAQIGGKNDRIERINADLQRKNEELRRLNIAVSEANAVKEEYIALLLAMCSDYIEKMLKMQRRISRRIGDGDAKLLEKELSAQALMDVEMRDFYNMFDSAFLRLYPDFIEEFHSLLHEDHRIVPPNGEMLDTELRIFALIRLGIDDSSKIATLLRYSPNTIYNYRAKVKNKAKGRREDFEAQIKTIGSFKSTF